MKKIFVGCGTVIIVIIAGIILFIGINKFIVYQSAKKIDWKVDDQRYLQNLYEELSLQHEVRGETGDTVVYLKDNMLTNEPMSFFTLRIDEWKKNETMEHTGSIGEYLMIPFIEDIYYEEMDRSTSAFPEVSLRDGKILIEKDEDVNTIEVESDEWYITHISEESLLLSSYSGMRESYLVSFVDGIEIIPFTDRLDDQGEIEALESLLLANPQIEGDQARFIYFDYKTVWDKQEQKLLPIKEKDLLSQDGKVILVNYKESLRDFIFKVQTVEQYMEESYERRMVRLPEKAIIEKSTLPAVGLGKLQILSLTKDRIIVSSNTPSFIFGTAGIVKFSVDLTEEKPHYTILYIEENK